ncbi:MAG: S-layer homology domain-containing protein [Oscillospiraceae bacterium]|nr:S-layer homology domain-containing protein [Oscillospiraceae bacterium]
MIRVKRLNALLLVFCLIVPFTVLAEESSNPYGDVDGHWAKEAILRWSDLGILKGSGGLFKPDDSITRAELAAIINKVLKFPAAPYDVYDDVADKWFREHVNALGWQGVYLADGNLAEGDLVLTREEAVEMLFRAFTIDFPEEKITKTFTDLSSVAAEYKSAVSTFHNMSFISGVGDGSFRPKEPFTRAQVVAILNNVIRTYITEPGTYEVYGKTVLVNAPGVKLVGSDEINSFIIGPGAVGGLTSTERIKINYFTAWRIRGDGELSNILEYHTSYTPANRHFVQFIIGRDARFADGIGTEDNPYLIENEEQLRALNEFCVYDYGNTHFMLANDISLSNQWKPIQGEHNKALSFYGTLDGAGYNISGLYVNDTTGGLHQAGLLSSLWGTVRNLTVSGDIQLDDSGLIGLNVYSSVGGICGNAAYATIENCISRVNITAEKASSIQAGGIVGYSAASQIIGCTFDGEIRVRGYGAYAHKPVLAGGIAGDAYSLTVIKECIANGTIIAISENYGTEQNPCAGGITGSAVRAVISDCYAETDVTAFGGYYSFAGGIIGLHTSESKAENCFATGTVHAEGSLMQNNAGGFAGQIASRVDGGTITSRCGAAADVSASGDPGYFNAVGGFAGSNYLYNTIDNCYSAGTVTVDGWASVGGFIGRVEGTIINSYTTTAIDAPGSFFDYSVNGLVGTVRGGIETEACGVFNVEEPHFVFGDEWLAVLIPVADQSELSKEAIYKKYGWDFDEVWTLPDGAAYPILRGAFEAEQLMFMEVGNS